MCRCVITTNTYRTECDLDTVQCTARNTGTTNIIIKCKRFDNNSYLQITAMASEINMENVAVVEDEFDRASSAPDSLDVDHKKNEDFIVRVYIILFNCFPVITPKITPAHHTRRMPFDAQQWSSSSFVDKDAIEAEWKAMFQHLNDILDRYKTEISNNHVPSWGMGSIYASAYLWMIDFVVTRVPDGYRLGAKAFFYGSFATLWILFIKAAIHTNVRYSDNSNRMVYNTVTGSSSYMNNKHDNIDTIRRYKHTMTTNRLLLQVDNMSGFETSMGSFGLWFVVMFIIYSIEQYNLGGWWYVAIFYIPMVSVSWYVLYHIGGCRSLFECAARRSMSHAMRAAWVWGSLCNEMRRHNDVLTNFTLRPTAEKVGFARVGIVIDVYLKNTNTLGFMKQSGDDQQQQQQQQP